MLGTDPKLAAAKALRAARDQSSEAARIVRLHYLAGTVSFLTMFDADCTLPSADVNPDVNPDASLASSGAALTTAHIAVFKPLGGGWELVAPPSPTRTGPH